MARTRSSSTDTDSKRTLVTVTRANLQGMKRTYLRMVRCPVPLSFAPVRACPHARARRDRQMARSMRKMETAWRLGRMLGHMPLKLLNHARMVEEWYPDAEWDEMENPTDTDV